MDQNTAIRALLVVALCLAGCLGNAEEITLPQGPKPPALTKDDLVVVNCEILRDAFEVYALGNGGEYPSNASRLNTAGKSLLNYLPNGQWLYNPYTGDSSEPYVGGTAAAKGSTAGWAMGNSIDGRLTGYQITGVGQTPGEFIFFLEKDPDS